MEGKGQRAEGKGEDEGKKGRGRRMCDADSAFADSASLTFPLSFALCPLPSALIE
jgi:hypothetical protein